MFVPQERATFKKIPKLQMWPMDERCLLQQRSEQISEGHREISSHVGKTLKYFCSLVSRLYSDITSQIGFLHSLQLERDFSRDVVGEVKLRLKRVRSCEGEI